MIRRAWVRVGKKRKFVPVVESNPCDEFDRKSERTSVDERLQKKAAEIRLRQAGFVQRSTPTIVVFNPELLKGKVIYVDSQLIKENKDKFLNRKDVTEGVVNQLKKMGATISNTLTKKVNYIFFMNGRYSTYQFSKKHSIPMVSSAWIEACKKKNLIAPHAEYPANVPENYQYSFRPRKYKRTYTVEHLEMLSERRKKRQKTAEEDPKPPTKKGTEQAKKTEKITRKSATKDKPAQLNTPKRRGRPRSCKRESTNSTLQENASPVRRCTRSVSVEVIQAVPASENSANLSSPPSSPVKSVGTLTEEFSTPQKRIRIESAASSPMASPPKPTTPPLKQIIVAGLNAEQYATLVRTVETLKGNLLTATDCEKADHLIWGGGRTINLIRGIAAGCRIISYEWIEESLKHGEWLPIEDRFIPMQYAVTDMVSSYGEIQRQRKRYGALFKCQLLQSVGPIYVNSGVKSCKPEDIKTLVRLCGGTLVHNLQDAKIVLGPPPDKLVLSTTTYVKEQWLYTVICNYKILPVKPFVYEPNQS